MCCASIILQKFIIIMLCIRNGIELVFGKRTSFDFYLAMSFMAFGISTILNELITFFFDTSGSDAAMGVMAMFLPPLIGGSGAAYLIQSRLGDGYLRTGLMVGIGSFFVDFVMSLALSGRPMGMLWILLGYLSGGFFGSLFVNRTRTEVGT